MSEVNYFPTFQEDKYTQWDMYKNIITTNHNIIELIENGQHCQHLSDAGFSVYGGAENIQNIKNWVMNGTITVDGTVCSGKSSSLPNDVIKVNKFMNINAVNLDASASMDYYILNSILERDSHSVSKDRSRYSNIAFMMLAGIIGNEETINVFKRINPMAYFSYLGGLHPIMDNGVNDIGNIIFLVDSDIYGSAKRMENRGYTYQSINDIFRSKHLDYFVSQHLAFIFIAKVGRYPIIDINSITKEKMDAHKVIRNFTEALTRFAGYDEKKIFVPPLRFGLNNIDPIELMKTLTDITNMSNR